MTTLAEHFFLLESETEALSGSQLMTRPIGVEISGHEVLIAIDSDQHRHLLIPVAYDEDEVEEDRSSQGVTLAPRVLRVAADDITYVDLHCHMTSLGRVFEELISDVLGRLANDRSEPAATCYKTLKEWRALLKISRQDISRETVVGLVGELEVLRLLAGRDPVMALDSWHGPSTSVHDFVRGDGAELEVKTTTSVDGNFVSISNIDQLDPTLVASLHLVVVHAREDPQESSLDERIDALVRLGMPQVTLLTKVASAGYVYGSGAVNDRFRIRSVRAWRVNASFPGLRRDELSEARLRGVSKIRYELALDSAPRHLPEDEFSNFINAWSEA